MGTSKLGGPLFKLGNKSFSKKKTTAVPPVDAAAAFVFFGTAQF